MTWSAVLTESDEMLSSAQLNWPVLAARTVKNVSAKMFRSPLARECYLVEGFTASGGTNKLYGQRQYSSRFL